MFPVRFFSMLKTGLPCLCLVLMSVAGTAVSASPSPIQPEWVRGGPHIRFSSLTHLTAVGSGGSRNAAERDALGRLVAIFGQDIHFDERTTDLYWEVIGSGTAASWGERIQIETYFERRAGMDNLIGAEIGDFWQDGRGTSFALAVLNKPRATQIYAGRIRANLEIIGNLTNMPATERNTFEGLARYRLASVFADMNARYGEVLSVLGAPGYARGLSSGDGFRHEAREIAGAIRIGINVRNDRAGRIRGAFAGAFSELGFRTGGSNPRYMLEVDISVEPLDTPGAPVLFLRMELSANLIDTGTGAVLLPYHLTLREGHRTHPEAEARAFLAAEERINAEYGGKLSDYLSRLVPRR